MHFEGFNIHALEGAIHIIARSISFVAVVAIYIDKTNIFSSEASFYYGPYKKKVVCVPF